MTESDLWLFLKAAAVGLSIAAPVGPIGLLTIQRTLQGGWASGLATGLGAAVADACYGAVGAFGVTWLIGWLTSLRVPLALGGGALLLWLAWQTWHTRLAERAAQASGQGQGLWGQFVGTVGLTLSNPATILSFIAIFGSLSGTVATPAEIPTTSSAAIPAAIPSAIPAVTSVTAPVGVPSAATYTSLIMVAGVLAGSAAWWLTLSTLVASTRHRFSPRLRQRINQASALFLAAFALWQVVSVLR